MQISNHIKTLIRTIRKVTLRGNRYYCPLCNVSYSKFLPMGAPSRSNARCPGCNSLERHRLLWIGIDYLQKQGIPNKGGRLLHIAPESCLEIQLRSHYDYVSVDMYASGVEVMADITALCFPDECFDVIICNHVLEHVPEDRKALSELYRVLKLGGWGSIQVPIKGAQTLEDLSVTDPAERARLYGQDDHVRQYGEDFNDRLRSAGFSVLKLRKEVLLEPVEIERLSVKCEEGVIFGLKPLQKI